MKQSVLGIDVSKETLDVVLLMNEQKQHQVFKNTPVGFSHLLNWLVGRRAGQAHACLEATGQYGDGIAEYLYQRGYPVSVVNPTRIKRYGESKLHRNKTDKADALLIAEFCAREEVSLWAPLPAPVKQLRDFVRRLSNLQLMYGQEYNRLHSGNKNPWVLESIQTSLAFLTRQIKETKKAMQDLVNATPELKRQQDLLISIPGIGRLTAHRLLAEIGDISRFEDASQLAAYAGLNPKGFRSGTSVNRKTRISKEGRAFFRYLLYMPAMVAMKHNSIVRSACERLAAHLKHPMELIVAAMKKLMHLVFGVLKHQQPFDPNYLLNAPFAS